MSYYSDFQRQRPGRYVSGEEPVEVARKFSQVVADGLATVRQSIGRGLAALSHHRDRRRSIAELRSLPTATLRDIGIERSEIQRVVRDVEQGRDPREQS